MKNDWHIKLLIFRCDIEQLNVLPKIWLEDMILAIKGFKEEIQLCPTRRSAGLPFIIQVNWFEI